MLSKGLAYEQIALKYLQKKGLTLLENNFHSRFGEIDLIMRENGILVFIEVRFRKTDAYGSAAESVNSIKQQKIIKSAKYYLFKNKLWNLEIRFDVIAISPNMQSSVNENISWHKSAFICG